MGETRMQITWRELSRLCQNQHALVLEIRPDERERLRILCQRLARQLKGKT